MALVHLRRAVADWNEGISDTMAGDKQGEGVTTVMAGWVIAL